MRLRARMSLLSMLLLTGLICVSVSHVWLSYNTRLLQQENKRQAIELGYLVIEDPSKAYVRQIRSPSPGVLKYRVYLPFDRRYVLRQTDSWFGDAFPGTGPFCQLLEPGDESEFVLTVTLVNHDGDLSYYVRGSRARAGRMLRGLGRPVEQFSSPVHGEQQELDPDRPIEVVRLRLGQSSRTRAETGLLIWISPLSDEELSTLGPPNRDGTFVSSSTPARNVEEAAARQVRQLGGDARFDDDGYLTGVTLQYVPVVDNEVEFLGDLSRLERLFILKTQITDASLEHLRDLTSLRDLSLCDSQITDAGLANLAQLTDLRSLRLWDTLVTDQGFDHLRHMTEIRELVLTTNNIGDEAVARLQRMKKLKNLYLGGTRVSGAGLKYLANMSDLRQLSLGNTSVNDAGLVHLSGLSKLHSLHLHGTDITDAGLVQIGRLTRLSTLSLAKCDVTDQGLVALASLRYLGRLNLNDTKVTSEGLQHLATLKQIQTLSLNGTALTDDAVEALLEFPHLGQLDIADTRLSESAIAELVRKMPGTKINQVDRAQKAAADKIANFGPSSYSATGRNVTSVKLSGASLTNGDLKHFHKLKHVEVLEIRSTGLTLLALDRIAELPRLRTLKLHGWQVTDAWLEKLAEIQLPIRELELSDVPITDAGLKHVAALPQLVRLGISDSQVSDAGLQHLANHRELEVYLNRTRATIRGIESLMKTVRYAESK